MRKISWLLTFWVACGGGAETAVDTSSGDLAGDTAPAQEPLVPDVVSDGILGADADVAPGLPSEKECEEIFASPRPWPGSSQTTILPRGPGPAFIAVSSAGNGDFVAFAGDRVWGLTGDSWQELNSSCTFPDSKQWFQWFFPGTGLLGPAGRLFPACGKSRALNFFTTEGVIPDFLALPDTTGARVYPVQVGTHVCAAAYAPLDGSPPLWLTCRDPSHPTMESWTLLGIEPVPRTYQMLAADPDGVSWTVGYSANSQLMVIDPTTQSAHDLVLESASQRVARGAHIVGYNPKSDVYLVSVGIILDQTSTQAAVLARRDGTSRVVVLQGGGVVSSPPSSDWFYAYDIGGIYRFSYQDPTPQRIAGAAESVHQASSWPYACAEGEGAIHCASLREELGTPAPCPAEADCKPISQSNEALMPLISCGSEPAHGTFSLYSLGPETSRRIRVPWGFGSTALGQTRDGVHFGAVGDAWMLWAGRVGFVWKSGNDWHYHTPAPGGDFAWATDGDCAVGPVEVDSDNITIGKVCWK